VQQSIAIMDSGVGGLTVVKEVIRQLPQEKICYFGDTARSPYGPRSPEVVRAFTKQVALFLAEFQPKILVIACNTATAAALEEVRKLVSVPVIGVIYPGARAAIKDTNTKFVGVIGTEGTIRSKAYERALQRVSPGIQVISQACPQFVPLVEAGMYEHEDSYEVIYSSLRPLIGLPIDCLILGCTHYPFLESFIQQAMGPNVGLINSAGETAREMSAILQEQGRLAKIDRKPQHAFFCSGNEHQFRRIAEQWLDMSVKVIPIRWNEAMTP